MEDVTNKKNKLKVTLNPDTTPILYTDNISISANEDGVVLNVVQKIAKSTQGRVVSRIGMSRKHAKKLVDSLGKILIVTETDSSNKKLTN